MFRNKKKTSLLTAFFVTSAACLPVFATAGPPDPTSLLSTVFTNPTQVYQGQMIVSYWSKNESRAEDVRVFFKPPNKYRFEFLAPNGSIDRVVMSNGDQEQVQLLKDNKVYQNYTTNNKPSRISLQQEKNLLIANYKATLLKGEMILGRPTWTIELAPLIPGKPSQMMKIDQATKVILEIKRYMPDGTTGSLTRFTKFEPVAQLDNQLFLPDTTFQSSTKKDLIEPVSDIPADELEKNVFLLPTNLHGGFALERNDEFEIKGKSVKHLRYTDGLLPVSIFQTPVPVKAPSQGASTIEWSQPLQMGSSNSGNIYQWKINKDYFTLIGEMKPELLQEIAGDIK